MSAVALLLVNDWILKGTVGGWWTGKLSDFAGLFAVPLFWSALFPKRTVAIFALTTVGFMFWKSPLSGPLLAAWNALGVWPLSRVVDYTDWVALAVLVPSYRFARQPPSVACRPDRRWGRRIAAVTVAVVAILAFTATSRAPPSYDFPPQEADYFGAPRTQVRATLEAFGWSTWPPASPGRLATAPDTVYGWFGAVSSREFISASFELRDAPTCGTLIRPISVRSWRTPDFPALRERFLERIMPLLHALLPTC